MNFEDDKDANSIMNRIIAEHRKYAQCGSYRGMENPNDWAKIAAIKIISDVRNGHLGNDKPLTKKEIKEFKELSKGHEKILKAIGEL